MRRPALLAALLAACAGPVRMPDPPHADAARESTMVLDGRCSAVVATARSLWTAGHCLRARTVLYRPWQGPEAVAELLALHDLPDLAELRTRQAWSRVPVARFPVLGEPAYVVHHRCPGGWCVTEGRVVYASTLLREAALDATPPAGASGSGVWGHDGALLGVVTHLGLTTGRAYFSVTAW